MWAIPVMSGASSHASHGGHASHSIHARISFGDWRVRYAYFIGCIHDNLARALSLTLHHSIQVDSAGMRSRLERYLYECSANVSKRFVQLSGPRPDV